MKLFSLIKRRNYTGEFHRGSKDEMDEILHDSGPSGRHGVRTGTRVHEEEMADSLRGSIGSSAPTKRGTHAGTAVRPLEEDSPWWSGAPHRLLRFHPFREEGHEGSLQDFCDAAEPLGSSAERVAESSRRKKPTQSTKKHVGSPSFADGLDPTGSCRKFTEKKAHTVHQKACRQPQFRRWLGSYRVVRSAFIMLELVQQPNHSFVSEKHL